MSINMIADPYKLEFPSESHLHSRSQRLVGSALALLLIGLIICGVMLLSKPDTLPIKQVRIEGDFTHLSPVDLQLHVTDKVRGGFFNLNVDAVRLALMNEPWVDKVMVQRVWPDALRVIVTEKIPSARWGDSGLLNPEGVYFEPERDSIPNDLPQLRGPEGSEVMLLERFRDMQKHARLNGHQIISLNLDDRRAWSFMLDNGIKVFLGRRFFEQRFSRFLHLIPTTFLGQQDQIVSIDMRYTNGFSIKWKK